MTDAMLTRVARCVPRRGALRRYEPGEEARLQAHGFADGATSVASSPITWPIRPPLATLHCETPPQWFTVPGWNGLGMSFTQSRAMRVAAWGLSRPTNWLERSLAKLTRAVTVTVPSGFAPAQTTGVPSGRMPEQGMFSPSRSRTLGLSK